MTDIGDSMTTHAILVSLNGRMGAGKSTVADSLLQTFTRQGLTCEQIQFSDVLRRRAQQILDEAVGALWGGASTAELAHVLELRHGPFRDDAAVMDAALLTTRIADTTVGMPDPKVRTPDMRVLLQRLGSSWAAPGYWPAAVVAECVARLDQVDAVITTCRYPDEAQLAVDRGGLVFRLDVSPATQRKRLAHRDGFITTQEALNHPGETALNTWPGFRRRFNTEKTTADQIAETILAETLVDA